MKYIYPAIFHKSENTEGYWVEFPDLEGCFSQGKTFEEAFVLSKEALSEYLIILENDNVKIPIPSIIEKIIINTNDIINLVDTNTLEYRKEADIAFFKKLMQFLKKDIVGNSPLKKIMTKEKIIIFFCLFSLLFFIKTLSIVSLKLSTSFDFSNNIIQFFSISTFLVITGYIYNKILFNPFNILIENYFIPTDYILTIIRFLSSLILLLIIAGIFGFIFHTINLSYLLGYCIIILMLKLLFVRSIYFNLMIYSTIISLLFIGVLKITSNYQIIVTCYLTLLFLQPYFLSLYYKKRIISENSEILILRLSNFNLYINMDNNLVIKNRIKDDHNLKDIFPSQ